MASSESSEFANSGSQLASSESGTYRSEEEMICSDSEVARSDKDDLDDNMDAKQLFARSPSSKKKQVTEKTLDEVLFGLKDLYTEVKR